ncbi:ribonuclease HII [Fundidesulfovibrio putealis]|uniref:ribonuclease HII n=1 Tax=Fundidesulfovibrio putealis TaxID=270496 RepID=UPI0003F9D1EB|nr:ribonuclease HII [Fundidesulfovibrio putealis]
MPDSPASPLPHPSPAPNHAGVDEAGRGCLAGPVVAGAVILPEAFHLPGLNDSKKLTAARRAALEPAIKAQAVAWGLGVIWPAEIDRINILQATFHAMARAVAVMKLKPHSLLIDGNKTIPVHLLVSPLPQRAIIEGDSLEPAISAASILAKTFRDRLLERLDRRYPGYALAVHKGYGTAVHLAALRALGPCPQHRLTFRGVLPEKPSAGVQGCLPGI